MYGGFSGCQGILLYNKTKNGCQGIYGYYKDDKIQLRYGDFDELKKLQREIEEPYCMKDEWKDKLVIGLFLGMLAVLIAFFVLFSLRVFAAALVFCVLSYMPILVLCYTNMKSYISDELEVQFKRYHGCEHACVQVLAKRYKEILPEQIKEMSIYDAECGTVYCGYLLFLALVLAVLIGGPLHIGLLKASGAVIAVIAILFVNLFNPWNPFKLLQRPAVMQPTEREYALGMALIENMLKYEEEQL